MNPIEKLIDSLREGCTCHEAYTSRGLVDHSCYQCTDFPHIESAIHKAMPEIQRQAVVEYGRYMWEKHQYSIPLLPLDLDECFNQPSSEGE